MTPYLQFRLWWRRGSTGDRLAVTLAAVVVVALAGWVLVPSTDDEPGSTNLQAVAGSGAAGVPGAAGQGGAAGPGPSEPATPQAGAEGAAATASAGPTSPGPEGEAPGDAPGNVEGAAGGADCLPTPPGAVGMTDENLSLAVALLDLAGPIGNSAANQASADDQQRFVEAIIADLNERGGAACRQVTAKYYKLNPIGADQGRSGCLQIIQEGPAMVADIGGFAFPQGAYNCIPQQKVPLVTGGGILTSEATTFAPYLATPSSDLGTVMRDTAFGLKDFGFFDPAKGFKKLGLLYDECAPEVNKQLDEALARAGIKAGQTDKYTFACPDNGFASPAAMAQAASQHRAAGVTHVIPLTGGGSFKPYTEAAERQGFRPKYAVTDYQGMPVTAASSLRPNPDNFDGAVDMTPHRFGLDTTPGFPLDPTTQRCQELATKAGMPPEIVFRGGGGACSIIWTIEAALNHAAALTPDAMLPGLFQAGPMQFAYPLADATFQAPSKFYGGETWTPIQWRKDCSCWHILDPNRRPSYAP